MQSNANLEFRKIPSLKYLYEVNENGAVFRNVKSKKQCQIRLDETANRSYTFRSATQSRNAGSDPALPDTRPNTATATNATTTTVICGTSPKANEPPNRKSPSRSAVTAKSLCLSPTPHVHDGFQRRSRTSLTRLFDKS